MQKVKYYILMLVLVLVGCTRDNELEEDVDFCVRAVWENGLGGDKTTRGTTPQLVTDLLAAGGADIAIDYSDYPEIVDMYCSDGTIFTLTKETSVCPMHGGGYFLYTPSVIYKDLKIKKYNLTFLAEAKIDAEAAMGGDRLVGEADKSNIADSHMQLTLRHTKTLVRFAFQIDAKYDKVRYIVVKNIKLNGEDCVVGNKVLQVDNYQAIGYIYIESSSMPINRENTVVCTYDIYDKDAKFDGSMDDETLAKHRDRGDVMARNTFMFNNLKDAGGNKVSTLLPGYYYDLKVTLNPDYLYVLSDHDNKQMVIE